MTSNVHAQRIFYLLVFLTLGSLLIFGMFGCASPDGVVGAGQATENAQNVGAGQTQIADPNKAEQIGTTAGGTMHHVTATGTSSSTGQTSPADNITTVNPDNSLHKTGTQAGTTIVFDQLAYDGIADLEIGKAEATLDPETGQLLTVLVEDLKAIRSDPIRADAEVVATLRDTITNLSAEQRAIFDELVPGFFDSIIQLLEGI